MAATSSMGFPTTGDEEITKYLQGKFEEHREGTYWIRWTPSSSHPLQSEILSPSSKLFGRFLSTCQVDVSAILLPCSPAPPLAILSDTSLVLTRTNVETVFEFDPCLKIACLWSTHLFPVDFILFTLFVSSNSVLITVHSCGCVLGNFRSV